MVDGYYNFSLQIKIQNPFIWVFCINAFLIRWIFYKVTYWFDKDIYWIQWVLLILQSKYQIQWVFLQWYLLNPLGRLQRHKIQWCLLVVFFLYKDTYWIQWLFDKDTYRYWIQWLFNKDIYWIQWVFYKTLTESNGSFTAATLIILSIQAFLCGYHSK